MNTHERFARMYAHQEADRVPMMDSPWDTTIERWRREGMPTGDYVAYFDLDRIGRIGIDYSPRYPVEVLEETPEYVCLLYTSEREEPFSPMMVSYPSEKPMMKSWAWAIRAASITSSSVAPLLPQRMRCV